MRDQHSFFIMTHALRYAQGQGQEYTMAYRITYWRPGMIAFKEYRDSVGRNVSMIILIIREFLKSPLCFL